MKACTANKTSDVNALRDSVHMDVMPKVSYASTTVHNHLKNNKTLMLSMHFQVLSV